MSRKITIEAIEAFYAVSLTEEEGSKCGVVWSKTNTQIKQTKQGLKEYSAELWLHGNKIAKRSSKGLEINLQGYATQVTKERLNGLFNVHIEVKDGVCYLNNAVLDCNNWTLIQ